MGSKGECLGAASDTVLNKTKSESVAASIKAAASVDIATLITTTLQPSSVTTTPAPYRMTLQDCLVELETYANGYADTSDDADSLQQDILDTQAQLTQQESDTEAIFTQETAFAGQLLKLSGLFENANKRATDLENWQSDEGLIRDQLLSIYEDLEQASIDRGDAYVAMASTLRNALTTMQTVHDHASKVITAVADSETRLYHWAFNVTSRANMHTSQIVSLAQDLQAQTNSAESVIALSHKLLNITDTLSLKYGNHSLSSAVQSIVAGNLVAFTTTSTPTTLQSAKAGQSASIRAAGDLSSGSTSASVAAAAAVSF